MHEVLATALNLITQIISLYLWNDRVRLVLVVLCNTQSLAFGNSRDRFRNLHKGAHRKLKDIAHCFPEYRPQNDFFLVLYSTLQGMTSLNQNSIYTGCRGNLVRNKLDCCSVTIKVSSFIVKTSNSSPSIQEMHTIIVYRRTTRRRILGILSIKGQVVLCNQFSMTFPCMMIVIYT